MNRNCSLARVIRSKNRQSIAGPSLGPSAFRARCLRLRPGVERIINNNQARRCDGTFDPRISEHFAADNERSPSVRQAGVAAFYGGSRAQDGLTLLLSGSVPPRIPCGDSSCFNMRELLEKRMVPNLCVAHSLVACGSASFTRQPGLPC